MTSRKDTLARYFFCFLPRFRTEIGAPPNFCPKYQDVSDVLQQEVGEKFGVRQKTVLSLHRQKKKATPTNGIANEKKDKFKV